MLNNVKNTTQSFSLRKIPISYNDSDFSEFKNLNIDKVKILEFSNSIDDWERELLFGENGFFSLKGKAVENKSKEFLQELNKFINKKISEIKFTNLESKNILLDIKQKKVLAIKFQLEQYEFEQLSDWELSVFEQALSSVKNRAILYKNNPKIISSSFYNALQIFELLALKENWNDKIKKNKIAEFESDFYYSLILSFISDKDFMAVSYFNKFKNKLNPDLLIDIENQVDILKTNIIAFNWACEIYSYNLDEESFQKEFNKISDDKIKIVAKKFIQQFKSFDKKRKNQEVDYKNKQNWDEINNILQSEPNKAFLFIDYSLSTDNQKIKKDYIKKIIDCGYVATDSQKFIQTFQKIADDFQMFKNLDLSDLQGDLSKDDFDFFSNLKLQNNSYILSLISDYNEIKAHLKNKTNYNLFYDILTSFIREINNYKLIHKKDADVEVRSKFIELILERFLNKKDKEHNK